MLNQQVLASQIFARSQGLECMGQWQCHWCGAPCSNEFLHDDPPPVPFVRSTSTAKHPSQSYCCVGCWSWRRPRVTVTYMSKNPDLIDYKDRQSAKNHSWFITENIASALRKEDANVAYKRLLSPPSCFVLMLHTLDFTGDTLLQLGLVNKPGGIIADTPLHFTVNNIHHSYSIYELEEAIKNGPDSYGPGIRQIFNFFGEPSQEIKQMFQKEDDDKKGRGRPLPKEDAKYTSKKVVLASGKIAK